MALVPPENIKREIQRFKNHFSEVYNSTHAQNAPPHITLLSPFRLPRQREKEATEILKEVGKKTAPMKIYLKDFGVFSPRVIFVQVAPSPLLTDLAQRLEHTARTHVSLFGYNYKERPFHPHITLAFKDLTISNFKKGWEAFKNKEYRADFIAEKMYLLKHNGKVWNIHLELPFAEVS